MSKQAELLGPFEQLVLAAVMTLGKNAYGVPIYAEVSRLAERNINMGSMYVTLDRLEEKGFLSSWESDATSQRRGKPKRFYRLETPGMLALQESVGTAQRVSEAFEKSRSLWKPKRAKA